MKKMGILFVLFFCVAALPRFAAAAEADRLRIFVTIVPMVTFTERVGGDRVQVEALVRPGFSPESYQPTPRQMAELAKARLYLPIGMPFETVWVERIKQTYPNLKVVDVTRGLPRRAIEAHTDEPNEAGGTAHDHGHEGHGHDAHTGLPDPHLWLDPVLARQMAAQIAAALAEADPAGKTVYEANLKKFEADLDQADREIRQMLAGLKQRKFMIYHPALGYFADRYGLKQIPIQMEGKDPTARELAAVIDAAKRDGIKTIFVQRQLSQRSAQAVAEAIGGRVAPVDDLAADYLENLKRIARAIAEANK